MWAASKVLRGCQAFCVEQVALSGGQGLCHWTCHSSSCAADPDGLRNEHTQHVTGAVGLGLGEEGRDGDADSGIAHIMVQADTPGTDKITGKESLREACVFRGFTDDKDQEKRV